MTPILLLLTLIVCAAAVMQPWIGVIAYYLLAVAQPQSVWPWIFGDLRISLFVTLATFAGFAVAAATGRVDFSRLLRWQSVMVLILWVLVNLSRYFGSFEDYSGTGNSFTADFILGYFNKIILFYFVAVLLIDDWQKLRYLLYTLCGIALYYTWWANKMFLTGQYWRFGDNGRLSGPAGLYEDENTFALLFVIAMPVLYYIGLASRFIIVRYSLWLAIPLSWHALFLTGSRGGLLALAVVCLYIFLNSYSKKLSVGMAAGLVAAVVLQGSFLLDRLDDTGSDPAEEVADPRLISWQVGVEMIKDHPFMGVGVGNFQVAFPAYHPSTVHVAHNTFLQFSANSGLGTGIVYLLLFYTAWRQLRSERRSRSLSASQARSKAQSVPVSAAGPDFRTCSGDLIRASLFGFFVCAIFLDLMLFEVFYCLLMAQFARSRLMLQAPAAVGSEAPDDDTTHLPARHAPPETQRVSSAMPESVSGPTPALANRPPRRW